MSTKPLSLTERLNALLEHFQEVLEPAPLPIPPPPAPNPERERRVRAHEPVINALGRQREALSGRIAALEAACFLAGAGGRKPDRLLPAFAMQVPAMAECLRQQPEAARMAASLVERFGTLADDIELLRANMSKALPELEILERIKGKYFGLMKIQQYFKAYPALHQLFDAGSPRPTLPSGPATRPLGNSFTTGALPGGTARSPGTGGLGGRSSTADLSDVYASADGTVGGVRPLAGGIADIAVNFAAGPMPGKSPLAPRARALLDELRPRIQTLVSALATADGRAIPPDTAGVMRTTIQRVAEALQASPAVKASVREAVQAYQRARTLVDLGGPTAGEELPALLTRLGGLGRQYQAIPALAVLFGAR